MFSVISMMKEIRSTKFHFSRSKDQVVSGTIDLMIRMGSDEGFVVIPLTLTSTVLVHFDLIFIDRPDKLRVFCLNF